MGPLEMGGQVVDMMHLLRSFFQCYVESSHLGIFICVSYVVHMGAKAIDVVTGSDQSSSLVPPTVIIQKRNITYRIKHSYHCTSLRPSECSRL